MRYSVVFALVACIAVVLGQQVGNAQDGNPTLTLNVCTAPGACTTENHRVVLDGNWRWVHNSGGTNCYTGNQWNTASGFCDTPQNCAQNCALEGVTLDNYKSTYGIANPSYNELDLTLVTQGQQTNVGSRVYLLETDNTNYKKFNLLNREFAFDVDASTLPCGVNGALYFTEMPANGGKGTGNNNAGAVFGTGYCDAQCPQDIKFINGVGNTAGWTPSSGDPNSGTGNLGSCCPEMDIWEANSWATAVTPHPCTVSGLTECQASGGSVPCAGSQADRYNGVCDRDGCDFNTFRVGNELFFGANSSYTINTQQPVTVVTQFITSDNTDTGDLVEIRRVYKQNGNVFSNGASTFSSLNGANSITTNFCNAQKTLFGDQNDFATKGGLKAMGQALGTGRGGVLVMSLWVDYAANCLWLDSDYPTSGSASTPGVARGPCPTNSGVPSNVISSNPGATVKFMNIRYGALGSTTAGISSPTTGTVGTTASGTTASNSGTTASNSGTTASNSGTTASNSGTTASNSGTSANNGGSTATNSGSSTATNGGSTTSSCNIGSERCQCTTGGACDAGLECLSGLCVSSGTPSPVPTCSVGSEGCLCIGGTGCNSGLSCVSQRCVKDSNDNSASLLSLSFFAFVAAVAAYLF